jgi:hypothetical protein
MREKWGKNFLVERGKNFLVERGKFFLDRNRKKGS